MHLGTVQEVTPKPCTRGDRLPPGVTLSMPCGYVLPRMLEHHTLRDLLRTWAACADCEMIRPPPLMWPGDGSYPSDGGVVSVGVHVACYWSVGGAS